MTQEEKQLLLQDLCARLPYGVKAQMPFMYDEAILTCRDISAYSFNTDSKIVHIPYLRPLSSMTEKEKKELKDLLDAELVSCSDFGYLEGGTLVEYISSIPYSLCIYVIDWLNAHHFDYRGLIEKGLALPAPKDMYNEIKEEKFNIK